MFGLKIELTRWWASFGFPINCPQGCDSAQKTHAAAQVDRFWRKCRHRTKHCRPVAKAGSGSASARPFNAIAGRRACPTQTDRVSAGPSQSFWTNKQFGLDNLGKQKGLDFLAQRKLRSAKLVDTACEPCSLICLAGPVAHQRLNAGDGFDVLRGFPQCKAGFPGFPIFPKKSSYFGVKTSLTPSKTVASSQAKTCLQALRVADISPLFPPHALEIEISKLNRCKPQLARDRSGQHYNIFTDGSCTVRHLHAENVTARAIAVECIQSNSAKQRIIDQYTRENQIPCVFKCVAVSVIHGSPRVSRC